MVAVFGAGSFLHASAFFLELCCWGCGCPAGHVCRVLAARPASIAGGRGGGALFWVFTVRRQYAVATLFCLQWCLWLAWRFFTFDPSALLCFFSSCPSPCLHRGSFLCIPPFPWWSFEAWGGGERRGGVRGFCLATPQPGQQASLGATGAGPFPGLHTAQL